VSKNDVVVIFVRILELFCKLADGSEIAVIIALNWFDIIMVLICTGGRSNCDWLGWV
jgi:hypothetical protein